MKNKNVVGVYATTLKDGTPSYRASITFRGKHIALGSFNTEKKAGAVYKEASKILSDESISISSYKERLNIPFEKFVTLIDRKSVV